MEVGIGTALAGLGGGLDLGRWIIWYGLGKGWSKGEVSPGRGVSELGVFGGNLCDYGGDSASFCHKRHVIHKKLGRFGTDIPVCAPELGQRLPPGPVAILKLTGLAVDAGILPLLIGV